MSTARYNLFPSKPAFRAYKSGNAYLPTAGDTIVFDETEYNYGTHYSTSTGRFTAPFDGVYHFSVYTITQGNVNNGAIKIYVNGARIWGGDVHFTHNTGAYWDYVHWSGDLGLSEDDYIHVRAHTPTTFHGRNWSHFTGHLVT